MALDIAVTWNPATARGDWSIAHGDLAMGNALLSAVMVSLFSDRVAPLQPSAADQRASVAPPTAGERRGWWGDAYADRPIGSRLWQLRRAIKSDARSVPIDAQDICAEALAWLIDDGIAATVAVNAAWSAPGWLAIGVVIGEPGASSPQTFQFALAWDGL